MSVVPIHADEMTWGWSDQPQDRGQEDASTASAERFPDSWRLLDDVELLNLPDTAFLIEGILQERGMGAIYSPPGAGKTTLLAAMQVSLAAERPFYGHRVTRAVSSVYVAAEDPSGYKMRLRAAKRGAGLPLHERLGIYVFPEPIDMRDYASVGRFRQFIEQARHTFPLPLGCVLIDTYAAATPGGNENSSEDATTAMVHAQQLRDGLDTAVVWAHHTNAGGSRERGHTAMRGAADFMISLTPEDDRLLMECSKQRNAAPFEKIELRMIPAPDGQGCVLRLATEVLSSNDLSLSQRRALAILRDTFSIDGATKTEWAKAAQDIPERTFYRVCKVLVERDLVKPIGSHYRVTAKGQEALR